MRSSQRRVLHLVDLRYAGYLTFHEWRPLCTDLRPLRVLPSEPSSRSPIGRSSERPYITISALLPPRNDPPLLNISVSRDAVARQDCSNLRSYRLRIFTEERNERRETSPPRRVCYLFAQRVCPFNERSRSDASVVLLCSDTKNTRSLYY